MPLKDSRRLFLNLSKFGIDNVELFGRYNYVNARAILPNHAHKDMIEICFLAKGCQQYSVNGEVFRLFGGDVFMTFPNEVHSTGDQPEEKGVLYWIILKEPVESGSFFGLQYNEAKVLYDSLLGVPTRHFKASWHCEQIWQKIVSCYFLDDSDLLRIEMKNLFVLLILDLIRSSKIQQNRLFSELMIRVVDYIDDNIFESLDIKHLAQMAGLSISRFKHRFKEELGMPPVEYVLRKKVEKAKRLLSENSVSIKDVAYDLSFSSPGYFATVFKQYSGLTPTDYKLK